METNTQSRGQFLKTLGLSTKALMAFYCIGAVSACSTDDKTVKPDNGSSNSSGLTGTSTGNSIDFTIDLNNTKFTKLKTVGEFAVIGDILVANVNGTYLALSKTCTHQGTTLAYRKAQGDIWCSNHGSEFKTDGSVKNGPASKALKTYMAAFDATANTLKIN